MIDTNTPSLVLTAYDRCDACHAAQATSIATRGRHELLFCGHHMAEHKLALEDEGWVLQHDTIRLEQLYDSRHSVPA